MGDDSHVVFGQTFGDEKGSVRRCVVVMQQTVLLSSNFVAKVFAPGRCKKVTLVCGIDCLACQGECFMNNPQRSSDVPIKSSHRLRGLEIGTAKRC
jgi:hypothetical protein